MCNMKALSLLIRKLWPRFCSRTHADVDGRAMTLAMDYGQWTTTKPRVCIPYLTYGRSNSSTSVEFEINKVPVTNLHIDLGSCKCSMKTL